jgi:hypothetical protein
MSRTAARTGLAAATTACCLGLWPGSALASAPLPRFIGCTPSNSHKVRPPTIVIACGDGNFYVTDLRWSRWNATSAAGAGTGHVNDCTPDCAAGQFRLFPVTVTLFRPRSCRQRPLQFTRITDRFTAAKPPGAPRTETRKLPFYAGAACP